ncbi:MAG TPA: hypothetical protein GX513_14210 [Firmicutes bacterium]|nr:hypothetical protein [Bacillota bacterium]
MQRGSRPRSWHRLDRRRRSFYLVRRTGGQLVTVQWLARSRYGVVGVVQRVDLDGETR